MIFRQVCKPDANIQMNHFRLIVNNIIGAMENWGLVTYRESFVLVDPENTSLIRKQSIALTVGHEIAHQWFGNLGKPTDTLHCSSNLKEIKNR